jgi:hypothetical protein
LVKQARRPQRTKHVRVARDSNANDDDSSENNGDNDNDNNDSNAEHDDNDNLDKQCNKEIMLMCSFNPAIPI